VLVLLVLFACGSGAPDAATPPPPTAPASPPTQAVEKVPPAPAAQELHPHMEEHFAVVSAARNALLIGDLDTAKERMSWIAHHEPAEGMPREWAPYAEAMRKAAVEASRRSDANLLAQGVATVARQCGSCHAAEGKGPHFEVEPSNSGGSERDHMVRHNEASEALWRGLVSADDAQWAHGAELLAGQEALRGLKHPSGEPTPDALMALGKQVHKLGAAGLLEMDWDGRAKLYGELVATCATCHVEKKVGTE